MLPTAFDSDRWDYVYYLKLGRRGAPVQQRLTVYFDGDRVARFENVGIDVPPPDRSARDGAESVSAPPAREPSGPAGGGSASDRF
jgi:outer membrane protein assembly factor BamE